VLTREQISDIRTLVAAGHGVQAVADVFLVSPRHVYRLIQGERSTEEEQEAVRRAAAELARARDTRAQLIDRIYAGLEGAFDLPAEARP
jgi:hypothetical protein